VCDYCLLLRAINSTALIHRTTRSTLDLSLLLDLNVYASPDSPIRLQTIAKTFNNNNNNNQKQSRGEGEGGCCSDFCTSCGDGVDGQEKHQHNHDERDSSNVNNVHKNDISSITIPLPIFLPSVHHPGTFHRIVSSLIWDFNLPPPLPLPLPLLIPPSTVNSPPATATSTSTGTEVEEQEFDLLRAKGFMRTRTTTTRRRRRRRRNGEGDEDEERCFILQGVRDVFDITQIPNVPLDGSVSVSASEEGEQERGGGGRIESKLVLIGKGFIGREQEIKQRFLNALENGLKKEEEEDEFDDEVDED
jgi:hypothetical protein